MGEPILRYKLAGWRSFQLTLSGLVVSALPERKHGARRASHRGNRAVLLHDPRQLAHAAGFEHPVPQVRVG